MGRMIRTNSNTLYKKIFIALAFNKKIAKETLINTEWMTLFNLLKPCEKANLLVKISKVNRGLEIVEYIIRGIEYRSDFNQIIKDKAILIVYQSMGEKAKIS
jgi:hypothetical protein